MDRVAMDAIVSLVDTTHHSPAIAHAANSHHQEDPYKVAKELSISVICIVTGSLLFLLSEKFKTAGVFMVFFGAQTGMNMYMKAVFSSAVVSNDPPAPWCTGECDPWVGFQAGFFVTGMQQFLSFFIFWIGFGIAKGTGSTKYELKVLKDQQEWIAVLCFAASFTLNIALNNYSLSLIPLTLNLIIRSCLPLTTYLSQWLSTKITTGEGKPIKFVEIGLMAFGVMCAGFVVWAKVSAAAEAKGGSGKDDEAGTIAFGVGVCVLSLFSGSVNLALAGVLGTTVKLDSMGTVVYNSIPATLLLLPVVFFYPHPVKWDSFGTQTDWAVAQQVWTLSKPTFALAACSSVLALVYNVLQFGIVQYMSATHVAFAGNFNKAATIPLALAVGLDQLPPGKWGVIMIVAAIGNIAAFAFYNVVTGGAGGHGHGGAAKGKEVEQPIKEPVDDDESDDEDDESEEEGCCS